MARLLKLFDAVVTSGCSFPCLACGKGAGAGKNLFCSDCQKLLQRITFPHCPGCGGPLDGVLEMCSKCMQFDQRPWNDALALFELRGKGQLLVRRFKFNDFPELARPFAALAAELVRENDLHPDIIVPVPLHWSRCFMRGYNQAALFCGELSRLTGIPLQLAMRRIRRTRQQATLNREQRQKNLKDAFVVKSKAKLRGKSVLLVDDVMTTGATLAAAAEPLKKAGVTTLCIMVIGRR